MSDSNQEWPVLGPIGAMAFERRGISADTAARYGIYTGRRIDNGEVVPDRQGNIVVFPYFRGGQVVGEKYRGPGKTFWQRKGGIRVLWNCDVLPDKALGYSDLIITEGEIDALTAIECQFPLTVSVPDGAPSVRSGPLAPIDEETERRGKFEYLWRDRSCLKDVKSFILAVDNDGPGERLRAELLRRFGVARCKFVEYPEGCKDLNDVLQQQGRDAVVKCLNEAKPFPISGDFGLDDYPDTPSPETFSCGIPDLDGLMRVWFGELIVMTGIPGFGKSTFAVWWLVQMLTEHDWTASIASFEIPAVPALRHKLRTARLGVAESEWAPGDAELADSWIRTHFRFIESDPADGGAEPMSLERLIEVAEMQVQRHGIRVLLIDPWNEIEHARPRAESEVEYQNRALRMLRKFAKDFQVIVIVIAHPTKEIISKDGSLRVPSLYDISGSAAWVNKPDHGIVIDIPDTTVNEAAIHLKKVRFNWSGKRGDVTFNFDTESETYRSLYGMKPIWKAKAEASKK